MALRRIALQFTLIGLCTGTAVSGSLTQSTSLEAQYDTNLVNSPINNEPLASAVGRVDHAIDWALSQKGRHQIGTTLSLGYEQPTSFTDVYLVQPSAGLYGLWQPTLGFTAAWYELNAQLDGYWHSFEQHRRVSLGTTLRRHQRPTDQLYYSAELNVRWTEGNEEAFTGLRSQASFYEDWALSPRLNVYAQQSAGYGRITTSYHGVLSRKLVRSHHLPGEDLDAESDDPDSVSDLYFDDDGLTRMLGEPWYTYGVDGISTQLLFGAHYQLSQNWAVDAAYRFNFEFNEDFDYSRHGVFTTLFYNWD
jgi:opacity protein-like surface antigen